MPEQRDLNLNNVTRYRCRICRLMIERLLPKGLQGFFCHVRCVINAKEVLR